MDIKANLCLILVGVILVSGCVDDGSKSTTTVSPEGGLVVTLLQRNVSVSPGGEVDMKVEVFNNENIDDTVRVYVAVDDLPSEHQADLSWFNWTDLTITIASGGTLTIPLGVNIPEGISGWRAFRVRAESTVWRPKAFTTGVLQITG